VKAVRVADVLSQTLPEGAEPLRDSEIFVGCEPCGVIALSSLYMTLKREIIYTCPTSHKPVVILAIRNVDDAVWKGAYRVGEFAIWHSGGLRFRGTLIPRSDLALREIRTRYTKERRKQKRQ
jgi:hypothetical protein